MHLCVCQSHWQFPAVEKDFELVQELIHVARSLRVQCGMTKEKPASKFSGRTSEERAADRTQLLLLSSSVGGVLPQPGPGPPPVWICCPDAGADLQPPCLLFWSSRRSCRSSTCRKPHRCGGPHLPVTPSCSGVDQITVMGLHLGVQTDEMRN